MQTDEIRKTDEVLANGTLNNEIDAVTMVRLLYLKAFIQMPTYVFRRATLWCRPEKMMVFIWTRRTLARRKSAKRRARVLVSFSRMKLVLSSSIYANLAGKVKPTIKKNNGESGEKRQTNRRKKSAPTEPTRKQPMRRAKMKSIG